MKLLLALSVVVLLAGVHAQAQEQTLYDVLKEGAKLFPLEELKKWAQDKLKNDKDAQKYVEYIKSDHAKAFDTWQFKDTAIYDYFDYLKKGSVPIYEAMNKLRKKIGYPEIPKRPSSEEGEEEEISPIIAILALLVDPPNIEWELLHLYNEANKIVEPHSEKIKEWILEKMLNDKNIQGLYKYIASERYEDIIIHIMKSKEYREYLGLLKKGKLPVDEWHKQACAIFKWKRVCKE